MNEWIIEVEAFDLCFIFENTIRTVTHNAVIWRMLVEKIADVNWKEGQQQW